MAISYQMGFVSTIMFDSKDKMNTDLFVSIRWFGMALMADVLECVIFVNLCKLNLDGFLPTLRLTNPLATSSPIR